MAVSSHKKKMVACTNNHTSYSAWRFDNSYAGFGTGTQAVYFFRDAPAKVVGHLHGHAGHNPTLDI